MARTYLTEEGKGDNGKSAVSDFTVVEEFAVIPPSLVGTSHGDVFDHFFVLELDDWRVAAAFTVIFGLS